MGSRISKISKDRLFALEEFMKNKTSFQKAKARPGLDILTGGTYTRIHSIKGLSKKTLVPLQTGLWWRNQSTLKDILCYRKGLAHLRPLFRIIFKTLFILY